MSDERSGNRIWSTVGVTLPIPDTFASVRFSFGHERYAKSDKPKDLIAAEGEMHEFNEKVLERRLAEHKAMLEDLVKPKKKKAKKK